MNGYLLNLFLKSIPKSKPDEFEYSRIILKPKKEWKSDIWLFSSLLFAALFSLIFLTEIKYVGTFFFLGGFFGTPVSLFFLLRAVTIYRNYEKIFNDDEIKKLVDK